MVAVRTGFPSPMQPMRGFIYGPPSCGSRRSFLSLLPHAIGGFPTSSSEAPDGAKISQGGSQVLFLLFQMCRGRRFGDSLEGMLRSYYVCCRCSDLCLHLQMPRPMEMGGAVQYFANGGNANRQAAESMLAAGIGNVGGKVITSGAQSIQDRFSLVWLLEGVEEDVKEGEVC